MKFEFALKKTFSYADYMALVESLVSRNMTSGPNQSQKLIDFTSLNLKRMQRLNKRLTFRPDVIATLGNLNQSQRWIVISEAWCGDAAQNLPIINKMASISDNIDLQIIERNANLDVMDAFLTNGGRSIPKLISVDSDNNVLFTWGSRPQVAQNMFLAHKKKKGTETPEEFKISLHKWYTKDKSNEVQSEFLALL